MQRMLIKKRFLFLVVTILLFSTNLKAQIEDIKVGTATRKMLVYAPSGIEANQPLLISMHGMNQDIAYQQNQTKWETIAKANNFVVVYPAGINNSWDISGTSDTDFILTIIDEMSRRYGIDRDRVYLSGFSMGGMMTYHAATKIADKIAAFAPVSGYLMGGPNTKSSRAIPIIHTHGTADDVVAYSGVSTCLNAWAKRNKCQTPAVVTKPYPVGKTTGDSKSYWGPGIDSVEIVLLSLNGKGHWHSIDGNGVNTSQEIWDFCKKYSLSYGVPKFVSASVANENPKQIQVTFSLPIKASDSISGFVVKIDSQLVAIDSVVLADSSRLVINLADSVLNSNEITLSYTGGNVLSTYEKKLAGFEDKLVENLLAGASPRIVDIATTENGDTLKMVFNKKMQLPSDSSSLVLNAEFNGDSVISVLQSSFFNSDSTTLVFPLGSQVFADYKLSLSYSGNTILSADSSLLKQFAGIQVKNNSKGLPVTIMSAALDSNSYTIVLEFSKSMVLTDNQLNQLVFSVNGGSVTFKEFNVQKNSIKFTLKNNLHFGDSISVSYTAGDIAGSDKGALEPFSNFVIENPLSMPAWSALPGKIEAEDYTLQFGTDKETTSDTGGGINVGWIETGDWLEYAIENNTDETNFEISFRLAAQSAGGQIGYYVDNVKMGQVVVPNTGGWQVWQSVIKTIKVAPGKHYLKFVATSGGFNINYFRIQKDFTDVNDLKVNNVAIYPNPVSNNLVIRSNDFEYNKIEIIDVLGKTVLSKSVQFESELNFPVSLMNGSYIVRVSNEKQSQQKNIIVENK